MSNTEERATGDEEVEQEGSKEGELQEEGPHEAALGDEEMGEEEVEGSDDDKTYDPEADVEMTAAEQIETDEEDLGEEEPRKLRTAHYICPDYKALDPDELRGMNITKRRATKVEIVEVSPDVTLKYGANVTVHEANNILWLEKYAPTVPIPKLLACYTWGPFKRRIDRPNRYDSEYETYIFMRSVKGQPLNAYWNEFDQATKRQITQRLKDIFVQLRAMANERYVGCFKNGPVTDRILRYWDNKGPFKSVEAFHNEIIESIEKDAVAPMTSLRQFIHGELSRSDHQIVITHGNLQPRNIIVDKEGHVNAITDWSQSGWYPAYWESAKAIATWCSFWKDERDARFDCMEQILQPHCGEGLLYRYLDSMRSNYWPFTPSE
ncbi:hypothetical protein AbraIFM66951_001201 [Aspergillus brasiliensis]|uniref:Aminoglycoside phosphotransferase domain-containing protein n=1 Tax=Aspergillus brasiliensis TaxID=319629 RepID=A0A9W5YMX0_9EURO|nr:hypothetical protein AbraCBS73388_005036 [Aspergillus brasiliensis]GKZ48953.1 hypothetical protein AbraIFM66951_001201 [Aspergillus brasiliensis]